MAVTFYLQTEIEDTNERRAQLMLARAVRAAYGGKGKSDAVIIANIERPRLPQLDGLILTEQCVGVIEFKNYPDQFDGSSATTRWPIVGTRQKGRQVYVDGGSRPNPYQQAVNAHRKWARFFSQQVGGDVDWQHLNGFVLFHPYLHPDSILPPPDNNHLWLSFGSVREIGDFLFGNRPKINLSTQQLHHIATKVLKARAWRELDTLLDVNIGYLRVQQSNGMMTEIPLQRDDVVTVGRSSMNTIQVDRGHDRVSGVHLHIQTQARAVRVFDRETSNGTWVDEKSLMEDLGGSTLLGDSATLWLGGRERAGACRIEFVRERGGFSAEKTAQTNIGN